jgi:hypothetical protein
MDYNKEVLPNQTNHGTECPWAWPNTEKDHVWKENDMMEFTANGLWFVPHCQKYFLTNKYLTMVIRFVDTPGKHRDLIRQETTSFFHIRAFTRMNSIKHSSKRNCLQLHQWKKTQHVSPALLWIKASLMETLNNHQLQNLPTTLSHGGMKVTLC